MAEMGSVAAPGFRKPTPRLAQGRDRRGAAARRTTRYGQQCRHSSGR